jgi:hypothetical protein
MLKGQISIGKEKAIELAKSEFWKTMSKREIAEFQMATAELCTPFDVFHEAMEDSLGRPIWTHEFALNFEGLWKELRGEVEAPTMDQILEMIPAEKRVILVIDRPE